MKYKIVVSEKLEKQLKKISNKIAKKIMIKIEDLGYGDFFAYGQSGILKYNSCDRSCFFCS